MSWMLGIFFVFKNMNLNIWKTEDNSRCYDKQNANMINMQYYKNLHKWTCISILYNLPTWMKNLWMLNWALNAWYMCSRSALSRSHSSFLLCFRASSLWKSMAYSTLPVSQMRCQISMAAGWRWLESGQVSKSLKILFRLGLFSWKTKTAVYISF